MDPNSEKPPSSTELFSSAKVVGEAARSVFQQDTKELDKAKVADAAGDLLSAASHYGKLEQTSVGQYVDKAEGYLHQYGSSDSTTTTAASTTTTTTTTESTTKPDTSTGDSGSGGQSEGGLGDYINMAAGFLKKN